MSNHGSYLPRPRVWQGKAERCHFSASQFRRQEYPDTSFGEIAAMSLKPLIGVVREKPYRDGKMSAIPGMSSLAPVGALACGLWG
jgi:hypothetical protein